MGRRGVHISRWLEQSVYRIRGPIVHSSVHSATFSDAAKLQSPGGSLGTVKMSRRPSCSREVRSVEVSCRGQSRVCSETGLG